MPTIDEAIRDNLARIDSPELGMRDATEANAAASPVLSTVPTGTPGPSLRLPVRGTYPPDIILDADFDDAVDLPRGFLRSRTLLTRLQLLRRRANVSKAVTTTAQAPAPAVPGTPQQVTNLAVSEVPTKLNGQMVAVVTATWTPAVGDGFYSVAQIWGFGYHGISGGQLVASGPSPLTFSMDATGETIKVAAVAMSSSGIKAPTNGAPQAQLVLSPTSGKPSAPVVTQTLTQTPTGYQFQFQFEAGTLTNLVDGYNIYRSTANDSSTATKIAYVKQNATNTGIFTFQDTFSNGTSSNFFYWVSAVDVIGEESALTNAQMGTVANTSVQAGSSSGLNPVASTPPSVIAANVLNFADVAVALVNGGNALTSFTWSAFTLRRADSSNITVPASSALEVPATPTLTQGGGGAKAARTYTVRTGLVKNGVLMGISAEASLAISANNLITVASPSSVAGYDGWAPLVDPSGVGNAESLLTNQASLWDTTNLKVIPIAFGTSWTEPTTSIVRADAKFSDDTNGAQALHWWGLAPSTTYNFFFGFDTVGGRLNGGGGATEAADVAAMRTWQDRMIPLGANIRVTTPAAGSSGSGSGGGGGGGGGVKINSL